MFSVQNLWEFSCRWKPSTASRVFTDLLSNSHKTFVSVFTRLWRHKENVLFLKWSLSCIILRDCLYILYRLKKKKTENNDCVLVALIAVLDWMQVRGSTGSDRKHTKAPPAPAWSTAPQPVGISCDSVCGGRKTARRKTLGVTLRWTNNSPHICPRQESIPDHISRRNANHCTTLIPQIISIISIGSPVSN